MLTIFTIPKAFQGKTSLAQKNAIRSWLELFPKPEIVLLGDDPGIREAASEFGVRHIPDIKKNKFGTPLLCCVFNDCAKTAKNEIIAYINCDIVLFQDFMEAIQSFKKNSLIMFLMSGRRFDLDVSEEIDFKNNDVQKGMVNVAKLHSFSGMDYFVFPKNFPIKMPNFAVGIPGWDNWLVYETHRQKIPFIDATEVVSIIHQSHVPREIRKPSYNEEQEINFKLSGGFINALTLREADWILTKKGLKRTPFPRNIFSQLALFYPWRFLLYMQRKLKEFLGRIKK